MAVMLTDSVLKSPPAQEACMRLVKLTTEDQPVFLNPEFVISVRKGMKDTAVQTVAMQLIVKESPEVVARLLGAEELTVDITPALTKSIDI
jgi:hypothetical protein